MSSSSCSNGLLSPLAAQVKKDVSRKLKDAKEAEDAIGLPQARKILEYGLDPKVTWKKGYYDGGVRTYIDTPELQCNDGCKSMLQAQGFGFQWRVLYLQNPNPHQ